MSRGYHIDKTKTPSSGKHPAVAISDVSQALKLHDSRTFVVSGLVIFLFWGLI